MLLDKVINILTKKEKKKQKKKEIIIIVSTFFRTRQFSLLSVHYYLFSEMFYHAKNAKAFHRGRQKYFTLIFHFPLRRSYVTSLK